MAKVLVVDDQAPNRELIVGLLRHRGHEPLEAGDGLQALAVVREALSDEESFDREHRRLLADTLVHKAAQLDRANRRLSALTELNMQLACERDPEALLDKVCRGARELLGASVAVLGVKDTAHPVLT